MKLDYRTPRRREGGATPSDPSEVVVPIVLLVAGLLLFWAGALWRANPKVASLAMGFIAVAAVLETVLGIVAAYATSSISGISFGELRTAALKLAGILVFTGSLAFLIPFGGLIAFFVYLGLLVWLFELDMREAMLFAVVLWVLRLIIHFALAAAFS
jgi:hypothetical protein